MPIFIDSWAWIALYDEAASEHEAVNEFFWSGIKAGSHYYTSNFVLAETITMIFGRFKGRQGEHYLDRILDVIKLPRFVVEEITPERFQQTIAMRRRYKDKPDISFTDLTSMVLMRELKIQEIFTADLHFAKVNLGFRLVPGL